MEPDEGMAYNASSSFLYLACASLLYKNKPDKLCSEEGKIGEYSGEKTDVPADFEGGSEKPILGSEWIERDVNLLHSLKSIYVIRDEFGTKSRERE